MRIFKRPSSKELVDFDPLPDTVKTDCGATL
jgi:hypothetical protein